MVEKPVEAQNEVLQLLCDAPSVRARFLEEQRDKAQLVAWLRDTCRLPEDELVSVADIFLEEKFRTVSQIEALQGRNREHWPEKLSKGHRVSGQTKGDLTVTALSVAPAT